MSEENRYFSDLTTKEQAAHLEKLIYLAHYSEAAAFWPLAMTRTLPITSVIVALGIYALYSFYLFLSKGTFVIHNNEQAITLMTLVFTAMSSISLRFFGTWVKERRDYISKKERLYDLQHKLEQKSQND